MNTSRQTVHIVVAGRNADQTFPLRFFIISPCISPRRLPHHLFLFRRRKAPRSGTDRYNETVRNEVKSPYGSHPLQGLVRFSPTRIPKTASGNSASRNALTFLHRAMFPLPSSSFFTAEPAISTSEAVTTHANPEPHDIFHLSKCCLRDPDHRDPAASPVSFIKIRN